MEITTVTSSYSRKISNKLYGGGEYETSDFFVSYTAELEPTDDPIAKEKELRAIAKEAVENAVADDITGFQGGSVPPSEFYKFLYDYVAGRLKDVNIFTETMKRLPPAHRKTIDTVRKARAIRKRDEEKTLTDNNK